MEKKSYISPKLEIVKINMEDPMMIPASPPAYPYIPSSAYE